MKNLKFALIGCGRISYKHIKALINNTKVAELVATCDIILKNDKIKKELYEKKCDESVVKVYIDYKEMLENEKIDIVTIATESGYHAEIAIYCMNKGKHVIVEKPMALSIEDAELMIKCGKDLLHLI